MSLYPATGNEIPVSADRLNAVVSATFAACGMSAADAALLSDTLVGADLAGVHSHGVMRVPEYVAKLSGGGVNPRGRPRILRDSSAALLVDGGNSMGQIGAAFAMRLAIERARETNVAVAAVRGSNHCGAMAFYAKMALAEDMIGLAATNALPTMAPYGGLEAIIGINPLAVALPALAEPPIVFDAAFSGSSHGKIRIYQRKGLPIPPTWAFDSDGKPTTDAARAVRGLLQPIGGHKGVGLAIVMGILSSVLSGAAYGTDVGDMTSGAKSGVDGHFFLAVRIAAFVDEEEFKSRVDRIIRQIRDSPKAAGVERLYAPGEIEAETEMRYRREGIPLDAETVEGVRRAAAEFSLAATI